MMKRVGLPMLRLCCRLALVVVCLVAAAVATADPVGPDDARDVVTGWLSLDPTPFDAAVAWSTAGPVQTFVDDRGEAVYYVVSLLPSGFVIVAADDRIEPIIAVVAEGAYDPSTDKPLGAMVGGDLPARMATVRTLDGPASAQLSGTGDSDPAASAAAAQQRWSRLLAPVQATASLMGPSNIGDVWVEPMVTSTWGQTTVGDIIGGVSCYNFYTPGDTIGSPYNYPCGCTATAMAQIMRYHQHPSRYVWSNMPLSPTMSITYTERAAIGELCYDAAMSVNTVFAPGGSSADIGQVPNAFRIRFSYNHSIVTNVAASGTVIRKTINCSLDARSPVIVGVNGAVGGHAVVADGYGYSGSTLYHHLNMGWSGHDNAWYALPNINSSPSFNMITSLVYNVFQVGGGEIVSGRVTDAAGNGLPGVTVSTYVPGYGTYTATTDDHGIYALTHVPSNRTFTVSATMPPHAFTSRNASTGLSQDWGQSGNVWGVDFVSTSAAPPSARDQSLDVLAGTTVDITLEAFDDGLPEAPGRLVYRIDTPPPHGRLIDPIGGEILHFPHTLANNGRIVRYHACSYYTGADAFDFVADDGGTAPAGGVSTPATVSINVQNTQTTEFAPQTNMEAKWPMRTSYHDSRTQVIYLSSEMGGPQTITDLALDVTTIPALPLNNWTIRVKHTSMSQYGMFDGFQTSGWTTVYRGSPTVTSLGWFNLPLQSPFSYNGSSHLMIDFSHESNTWAEPPGYCAVSAMGNERVVMAYADSTHGDPRNWSETYGPPEYYVSDAVPNLRLTSSVQGTPLVGDFEVNCRVDTADLEALADAWLSQAGDAAWDPACDISPMTDLRINHKDFAVFADKWLDVVN